MLILVGSWGVERSKKVQRQVRGRDMGRITANEPPRWGLRRIMALSKRDTKFCTQNNHNRPQITSDGRSSADMPSSGRRHPAYTRYHITGRTRQSSSDPSSRNSYDTPAPEIEEPIDKPLLALNYRNKYLGGAAWRPADSTLIILGDTYCVNTEDLINLGSPRLGRV
jgi:hypothetical protein